MAKKRLCYSGIGGQAVIEGVMMKNEEKYAVAVRKANGKIAIEIENFQGLGNKSIRKIPFVRGVVNFIDSLSLGSKALNYSASFFEEEDEPGKIEKAVDKMTKGKTDKLISGVVTVFSLAIAIGLFILLPYYLSSFFDGFIRNTSLMAIIEGVIRIAIFLLYVWGISFMKDIKRLYRYHGAEHKCINCIERGRTLTVKNVQKSSRFHKRCGTSFIFFVFLISIILFFFIRVDNIALKVLLRILLMPVIAGISYEFIRLAGRSNNPLVKILSAPGMLLQRITVKEPDAEMIEVGIASVEAVFDWKRFLIEKFGYEEDDERFAEADAANAGIEEEYEVSGAVQ